MRAAHKSGESRSKGRERAPTRVGRERRLAWKRAPTHVGRERPLAWEESAHRAGGRYAVPFLSPSAGERNGTQRESAPEGGIPLDTLEKDRSLRSLCLGAAALKRNNDALTPWRVCAVGRVTGLDVGRETGDEKRRERSISDLSRLVYRQALYVGVCTRQLTPRICNLRGMELLSETALRLPRGIAKGSSPTPLPPSLFRFCFSLLRKEREMEHVPPTGTVGALSRVSRCSLPREQVLSPA